MEPTIADLRNTYRRLPDDKLIRIASNDAGILRPEAVEILIREIKKRGLSENLITGIEIQREAFTYEDFEACCNLIRRQPCPDCGTRFQKLNATITAEVVSILVVTHHRKKLRIACPSCLDEANRKAMRKSALLGWWAFPWGIVETVKAIHFNWKMGKSTQMLEANESLIEFVFARRGQIESMKDQPEKLQRLIKHAPEDYSLS
jgi:hypothetical protein